MHTAKGKTGLLAVILLALGAAVSASAVYAADYVAGQAIVQYRVVNGQEAYIPGNTAAKVAEQQAACNFIRTSAASAGLTLTPGAAGCSSLHPMQSDYPASFINYKLLNKLVVKFSTSASVPNAVTTLKSLANGAYAIENAAPNNIYSIGIGTSTPPPPPCTSNCPPGGQGRAVGGAPSDTYFAEQWSLKNPDPALGDINVANESNETAWDTAEGDDVIVAVIDTGVDYNHEDLAANMWKTPSNCTANCSHGYDFVDLDTDPMDTAGHGTHVAGIIAAVYDNGAGIAGIAPRAKIMALRVSSDGSDFTDDRVAAAIRYAVLNGVDVINMSFYTRVSSLPHPPEFMWASAVGVTLVASAGNLNANVGNPLLISKNHYPAAWPGVIAVAATDKSNQRVNISGKWQSARGANPGFAGWVDISAPGLDIISLRAAGTDYYDKINNLCVTGVFDVQSCSGDATTYLLESAFYPTPHDSASKYYTMSGTSMAAPHVAGVAALIKSLNPTASNQYIENILKGWPTHFINPAGPEMGAGVVNAIAALHAVALPGVIWVDPNFAGGNELVDGSLPIVYHDLQAALDAARPPDANAVPPRPGDEIRLVQGRHETLSQFGYVLRWVHDPLDPKDGIKIIGGFKAVGDAAPEADPSKTVLGMVHSSYFRYGGLIYTSGLTNASEISNLTLAGGQDIWSLGGAAMKNVGSNEANGLIIRNVIFRENDSYGNSGAVMNVNTNPTFINTVFHGNTVFGEGVFGGAMFNDHSSPVIVNSTFTRNLYAAQNTTTAGMRNINGSSPIIVNSIMWETTNVSMGGYEISNDTSSSAAVQYSNIRGGYADPSNSNIGSDLANHKPAFWNNVSVNELRHLDLNLPRTDESQPVNVGIIDGIPASAITYDSTLGAYTMNVNDRVITLPSHDMEGRERPWPSTVTGAPIYDMGACELKLDYRENYIITASHADTTGTIRATAGRPLTVNVFTKPVLLNVSHLQIQSQIPWAVKTTFNTDWDIDFDGNPIPEASLTWTPTVSNIGSHALTLKVCSGPSGSCTNASGQPYGQTTFTVLVAANQAPVWGGTSPASPTTKKYEEVGFQVFASDPDGDTLQVSPMTFLPGAVFDYTNRVYTWTPTSAGAFNVNFSVSDGLASIMRSVTISVISPPVGSGGTCFLAGTAITMADGSERPIESLKIGERVLSYDTEKNETVPGDITQVFIHNDAHEGYFKINDLNVTEEHPLWIKDRGWVNAGEVKVGDLLMRADGASEEIATHEFVPGRFTVYNVEVEPHHNYLAEGKLVHNKLISKVMKVTCTQSEGC